jgi:hypothetical protein
MQNSFPSLSASTMKGIFGVFADEPPRRSHALDLLRRGLLVRGSEVDVHTVINTLASGTCWNPICALPSTSSIVAQSSYELRLS